MFGTHVNPFAVKKGDKLATKHFIDSTGRIVVAKTRTVGRVETCNKPENVHIDGECYDSRFSTVIRADK